MFYVCLSEVPRGLVDSVQKQFYAGLPCQYCVQCRAHLLTALTELLAQS